jgi:hypothetical protein
MRSRVRVRFSLIHAAVVVFFVALGIVGIKLLESDSFENLTKPTESKGALRGERKILGGGN